MNQQKLIGWLIPPVFCQGIREMRTDDPPSWNIWGRIGHFSVVIFVILPLHNQVVILFFFLLLFFFFFFLGGGGGGGRLQSPAPRLFTQPFIQGADQRKNQSSTSLAFVRGIHRWPVNSPHKGPVTRKMFPFDDVTMSDPLHRRICESPGLDEKSSWQLTELAHHLVMVSKITGHTDYWLHVALKQHFLPKIVRMVLYNHNHFMFSFYTIGLAPSTPLLSITMTS